MERGMRRGQRGVASREGRKGSGHRGEWEMWREGEIAEGRKLERREGR